MADLRNEFEKLRFENIETLLNSGNILFSALNETIENLESKISEHIERIFGFPIPTIVRKYEMIHSLLEKNPFKDIIVTKDTRLYVSFLRKDINLDLQIPWVSEDNSYRIIGKAENNIFSVLDLSFSKTSAAMGILEKQFGKDITTRNWNTIERIGRK